MDGEVKGRINFGASFLPLGWVFYCCWEHLHGIIVILDAQLEQSFFSFVFYYILRGKSGR
jgi:hypothetical protein